ncbi:14680_t:CDS:10 [Acaulospora morrowiae]|uniref:14680_t:CDS:1 n=1 Tax=Acaulospora morrowiae TaxID=94023 RepID=A0A9N8W151_9GLOM|nr:14680_t:CDS:10 [Acaulospora morrowiae]
MAPMPPLKLTLKANADRKKGGKYSRRPPLLPPGGPKQIDTSVTSPGNYWATLVPLEAGLPKIYLTEGSHVLGKHCERREDLDRFKLLPDDKKISNSHCLIYRANSTVKGLTRTVVHLQNLGRGTLVRNIFVGDSTIELYGSENISFPSSREEKPWYRYQFFLENTASPPMSFFKTYAIQGDLGKGKFSEVKLARLIRHRDFGHSPEYAVKVIEKKLTSGKHLSALRSEITIMHMYNHPSLTKIIDVFDEGDKLYLLMENVRDGDFFDFINKRKRLGEDETRIIFKQLFEVVKYLHCCRIVHRDLKPENILVTDAVRYQVKISDFGLSKLLGAKYSLMNTVCGTPTYVAPEIINRDTEYGKAVDMWSLGVILYICLCGHPPFSEHFAPPSLLEQVRSGRYSFRSPPWDNVSDEAKDLVQGLLRVDFERRLTAEQALAHPFMQKQTSLVPKPLPTLPDPNVPLRRVHDQSAGSSNEEFRRIMTTKASALIDSIESADNETFLTATDTIASSSELSIGLEESSAETMYTATESEMWRHNSSRSSYESSQSFKLESV